MAKKENERDREDRREGVKGEERDNDKDISFRCQGEWEIRRDGERESWTEGERTRD